MKATTTTTTIMIIRVLSPSMSGTEIVAALVCAGAIVKFNINFASATVDFTY